MNTIHSVLTKYDFFLFRKYEMKLEDIEGFRYRSRDAWRAATRIAVREARLKEIKHEIVNSTKLKVYLLNLNHNY